MSQTRETAVQGRTGTMVGTTLGNYRIVGPLSSGGMGRVFRAQHEILNRPAAIKLLRPELSENSELVQRFCNEAKAATAIKHPGIVEVYDFGYTTEGHAYIVMEFLEGKPLSRALKKVGRYTEMEAANIARGIASALKAAHGKGIVHRDLKPDNVFLEPDLEGPTGATRAKVLDFGIAKLTYSQTISPEHHHTQAGILLGTPLYMAPEQARAAAEIDHRADLYSLGCILYELLVGEPPFLAEGAGEIIAMQMFSQPVPPSARVDDISPDLEHIVLKLLAKEPRERFQSAGEVVHALDAIGARWSTELGAQPMSSAVFRQLDLQSSGVRMKRPVAPPTEAIVTNVVPRQRSSLPVIAGTATILIAIGVIVLLLLQRGDDDEPSAPTKTEHERANEEKPNVKPRDPEPIGRAMGGAGTKANTEPPPDIEVVDNHPKQKPPVRETRKKPTGAITTPAQVPSDPKPKTKNDSPIEPSL